MNKITKTALSAALVIALGAGAAAMAVGTSPQRNTSRSATATSRLGETPAQTQRNSDPMTANRHQEGLYRNPGRIISKARTQNDNNSNSINPLLAPTQAETAYGILAQCDKWMSAMQAFPIGIYSIPTSGQGNVFNAVNVNNGIFGGASGAVYTPDAYYLMQSESFWGITLSRKLLTIDPNTWELKSTRNMTDLSTSTIASTFDQTSGLIYGYFINENKGTRIFGTFNTATLAIDTIATYTMEGQYWGNNDDWGAMVSDNSGNIYAFTKKSDVVKVNKKTGERTVIGNMGLNAEYTSTAAFNYRTGECYYTLANPTESALYKVDLATGKGERVYTMDDKQRFSGMFFYYDESPEGIPNVPTNIQADFQNGSLSGKVSFTIPEGNGVTGDVKYVISANGETVAEGNAKVGATTTADIKVPESAYYTLGVRVGNDKGYSPISVIKKYIGIDAIENVTNVNLTELDCKMTLTWDAPAPSNGGFVDYSKVSYTVRRLPDDVVVAENLKETSFTETVEQPKASKTYWYSVSASYEGQTTTPVNSNSVVVGAMIPPFMFTFDDPDEINSMTMLSNNGDLIYWKYTQNSKCAFIWDTKAKDDWMILPPVRVEKGKVYDIGFDSWATRTETIEMRIGYEPTPEGLSTSFIEPTQVTSTHVTLSDLYTADKTGLLYIGIHAMSPQGGSNLFADNIYVSAPMDAKAPGKITDITVEPGDPSSLSATITAKAPTTCVDGSALSSIDKINVLRNGKLIGTASATPGQTFTFTDNNKDGELAMGNNVFTLVAVNAAGEGMTSSVTEFIGFVEPAPVSVIKTRNGANTGEVVIEWEAPKLDKDGHKLPATGIKYEVVRQLGESLETIYVGSDLTFTDKPCAADATQDFVYYGVSAAIDTLVGEYGVSNFQPVGKPSATPWKESFTNKKGSSIMGTTAYATAQWGLYDDMTVQGVPSADGDNGFAMLYTQEAAANNIADLFTGNINLEGLTRPGFTFYYYGYESKNVLTVMVRTGFDYDVIRTINIGEGLGWTRVTVDLSEYAGKNIQICLRGQIVDTAALAIDALKVDNLFEYDLQAGLITAPEKANADEDFNIFFSFTNDGTKVADKYNAILYRNGEAVEMVSGRPLAPGVSAQVAFTTSLAVTDNDTNEYSAEVSWDKDQDDSDNLSNKANVVLRQSPYPAVTDLKGTETASGFELEWSDVDLTKAPYETTEEGVENYPAFSNGMPTSEIKDDSLGEWTVYDRDKANTFAIQGEYFPNQTQPMAWMVFNGDDAGIAEILPAHSGNQTFACFGSEAEHNDDWLVSPELNGEAQEISFFAKTGIPTYGLDSFEIYYSESGKEIADFKLLKTVDAVPAAWVQYSYELPAGAKYFAIRCVSRQTFVLLVDDIKFVKAGAAKVQLSLIGYNVYRNILRINPEPSVETNWVDAEAAANATYYVTALYNLGESSLSNGVVRKSGVDTIANKGIKVETAAGRIIVTGAEETLINVYDATGRTIYSAPGTGRDVIEANSGIYLVKIGKQITKVIL